jgi:SAM-dependent methyltransferase
MLKAPKPRELVSEQEYRTSYTMSNQILYENPELEFVTCPICGPAPNTEWTDDGKPTRYIRCLTCGTVYASPRAPRAQRYAWLDKEYGMGPRAMQNEACRGPALADEAALIHRCIRGGRMLDIGCDLGILFKWFPSPQWQWFGVELSPSAAEYAARTHAAEVYAGTIHQTTFPDAFFDLVTMMDVLSLMDNPRAELQEVARILKPTGLLAIELSGQAYYLRRIHGLLCLLVDHRWTKINPAILFWLNPESLRRLLRECGFVIKEAHVISSPVSSSEWRNGLTRIHYNLMSFACRISWQWLNWAPKYLVLAEHAKK